MSRTQSLTNQELTALFTSKYNFDKELRHEIALEVNKRKLETSPPQEKLVFEGLAIESKVFYFLLGFTFLPMFFAAKYLGIGNVQTYRIAWRLMVAGYLIYMVFWLVYFGVTSTGVVG